MDQAKSQPAGRPKSIRTKLKAFSVRAGIDLPFFLLILLILGIGLIMLFSSSYAYALAYKKDSLFYVKRQLIWMLAGIVGMLGVSYFDYHKLHRFAIPVLALSYALLAAVLVLPTHGNARRWIYIGSASFQPSEITKFALILIYAHLMSKYYRKMTKFLTGIIPYVLIFGSTAALLILEPHLSCTMIMFAITALMMFFGGVKVRWFVLLLIILGVIAYIALFTDLVPYASDRIGVWRDPFGYPDKDKSHQTRQSLYAIGSGGLLGLGLGNSRQKYLYLPEPQNDFIFSVICEELGLVGAALILALFGLLIWRGALIALRAPDKFGTLLAMGLISQVGLQVLLNVAVVSNTIPNTGISLPFFSYGGTSLVMLLCEMGVVLSVSRSGRAEKT